MSAGAATKRRVFRRKAQTPSGDPDKPFPFRLKGFGLRVHSDCLRSPTWRRLGVSLPSAIGRAPGGSLRPLARDVLAWTTHDSTWGGIVISVRLGARGSNGGRDTNDFGNSHRVYVQAMRAAQAADAMAALPAADGSKPAIRLDGWLRACMGRLRLP